MYHVVLHKIFVSFELVGLCPTLSKDGPLQRVNNIIIRCFYFSMGPMALVSYLFFHRFPVNVLRAPYIVIMFANKSSQYHVIFNHVTVFFVFMGKSTVELCDPLCAF